MFASVVLSFFLLRSCYTDSTPKIQTLEEMTRQICLEKTGYKPLNDKNTYFRIVEVVEMSNVTLPCSYCGESIEDLPKIWLWRRRAVNSTLQEVDLGLAPVLEDNRMFTYPNHSLTIHNVTVEDTGLYLCRSLMEDDPSEFQFSLDVVRGGIPVVAEKSTTWAEYNTKHILKVNELVYKSKHEELAGLLDKVKVKVTSEWDPWLVCDGCVGLRRRYAKCRVRSKLNQVKYPNIKEETLNNNEKLIHQSNVISCHSEDLHSWFPYLYSLTNAVPNFEQVQSCYGTCTKADRMGHEPRWTLSVRLDVGSSMSFMCPESDLTNKVVWRKDGVEVDRLKGVKVQKPKKDEPISENDMRRLKLKLTHVFVDRMNILQLCAARHEDSGEYVCYVDKEVMKAFKVTVVTAEETQQERYYHFLLLSVYTCTLSSVVVMVGIIWAYMRREEFSRIALFELDL